MSRYYSVSMPDKLYNFWYYEMTKQERIEFNKKFKDMIKAEQIIRGK